MEVLSDILRSMRVEGSVYFCDKLEPPWQLDFNDTTSASFHLVRRGECRVISGDMNDCIGPGDLLFVEPGRDHVLQSPPGATTGTLLLCGYFEFSADTLTPLLDVFPSLEIVRDEELLEQRWLRSTLDQLSAEYLSQQPGSDIVVNKLTEVVLVELIRLNFGRDSGSRFVAALSDRRIAGVLDRLHGNPEVGWTLDRMAGEVGISRALLAKRFRELVGVPMFEYLTVLRMERAKEWLRDTKLPLWEVANRVGYESDVAFTKTFRKRLGLTPTAFRKQG